MVARISHTRYGLRCGFGAPDARRMAKCVSGNTHEPSDAADGRRNATRRAGQRTRQSASKRSRVFPDTRFALLLLSHVL